MDIFVSSMQLVPLLSQMENDACISLSVFHVFLFFRLNELTNHSIL